MTRGLFIVFEGVEGSGKSTQAALLAEWLAGHGIAHVATREPGGTAAGEEIRRILLEGGAVGARAELLLMLAARAVFVDEVVRPALDAGRIVVADRYALSTLAYQGYGRGLPLEVIREMNAFASGGVCADLTLVLDVPVTVGEERRVRAGRSPDRIEQAGTAFHARVAEAYRLLADTEPGVVRLDGTRPPDAVRAGVLDLLCARFPEPFQHATG